MAETSVDNPREAAVGIIDEPCHADAAPPRNGPRYFHLLWEHELDDLQPILELILERRHEVVSTWYDLYTLHFGDSRRLSRAEFFSIFEPSIAQNKLDLLNKDIDAYSSHVRALGERLAERRVTVQEIIASMHLFEEACHSVFPKNPQPPLLIYTTFDKLSHIRIILLVDAYFRSRSAIAGARIHELEREASQMPASARTRFHGLVGDGAVMHQLYERIEAAGETRGTILIVGESGTGKELAARAIHEAAGLRSAPFVALNCAAIPKDLIESELFGHKRGAFSGANADYLGLFRAAHGGTLFLDEITEMSPDTQSKLLRAIQERTVRPVGSTSEVTVDVRVIASTNRDPLEAVEAGQLRQDLYYRLQAAVITVPPLREHAEDLPILIDHFITLFNAKLVRKTAVAGIENDAMCAMQRYSWPGNVRELSNAIEAAFTFGRSPTIRLEDLPPAVAGCRASQAVTPAAQPGTVSTFAEAERELISRALESAGGNRTKAARTLRISRKKLYAKIAKYSL